MRVIMFAGLIMSLGVLIMGDTATADDEKKGPSKKENYDEKVTVRPWAGSKFNNPIEDVLALRGEIKGKQVIYIWFAGRAVKTPKKSEIIDAKGDVWVVDESKEATSYYLNYVTKKEPEKKP